MGDAATRQRILEELPGREVLHLAAHVVVDPRDPLDSFVATADPGRAPLHASDLDAKRLAGVELVFLAACDTAPGFSDGDREGVAGLARAFLGAGVPSVVATLWAVDDQAASRLAVTFHSRLLQGEAPADALRFAQLALLSEMPPSAPFAWAPFQLYCGI
jgi:CHAT domain-containing protein